MKSDLIFLNHILESIAKIEIFTKDMSEKDFALDDKTQFAVIRLFEIIGEAANHISQNTTLQIPDMPWQEMVGFRNILIHEYFNVDNEIVWKTIQVNLPEIKNSIQEFLITI